MPVLRVISIPVIPTVRRRERIASLEVVSKLVWEGKALAEV